jgi:hypothetical protein
MSEHSPAPRPANWPAPGGSAQRRRRRDPGPPAPRKDCRIFLREVIVTRIGRDASDSGSERAEPDLATGLRIRVNKTGPLRKRRVLLVESGLCKTRVASILGLGNRHRRHGATGKRNKRSISGSALTRVQSPGSCYAGRARLSRTE